MSFPAPSLQFDYADGLTFHGERQDDQGRDVVLAHVGKLGLVGVGVAGVHHQRLQRLQHAGGGWIRSQGIIFAAFLSLSVAVVCGIEVGHDLHLVGGRVEK